MSQIAGHCGNCGAPYSVPSAWWGITPPPATPTCACWNVPETVVTTGTGIQITRSASADFTTGPTGQKENKMRTVEQLIVEAAESGDATSEQLSDWQNRAGVIMRKRIRAHKEHADLCNEIDRAITGEPMADPDQNDLDAAINRSAEELGGGDGE